MDNSGDFGEKLLADDLTWRERDVLILLAERLTNKEIANRLHLAESTVKDYVGRILGKMYVKNRRQAVEKAQALGLLEGDQKPASRQRYAIPSSPTPFVGRRVELEEIKRILSQTNLLTITGPGGMGKTRLAMKAAEEIAGDFSEGACFVPLAPIHSPEHIIQKVAEGLNLPLATQIDPHEQLLRFLKNKQVLLVIDNFEHVIEGAGILNEILSISPAVKILVTSREKLNLTQETNFSISGLSQTHPVVEGNMTGNDAVALFLLSANKVCPGYSPTRQELNHIGDICQAVEGMPLAIELAASWLHLLRVEEIAEEIRKGFDILSADMRDMPERHRSMRVVCNHSWSILDVSEQEIVKKLSIFKGGFTREAAEDVAGASLEQLSGLVNKSFLSRDPASGRMGIHEMLRQYAQEVLEQIPDAKKKAQQAHTAYYAAFMRVQWEHLRSPRQLTALDEIEADIENIRAAWRYALAQKNSDQIWDCIYSLWFFYWIRWWNQPGMRLFEEAVESLAGDRREEMIAARALSMALQAYFMGWVGFPDQAYQLAKESITILEKLPYPESLVLAYRSQALSLYFFTRYSEFTKSVSREWEIASALSDRWYLGFSLFAVGMGALISGNYEEAKRITQSNMQVYEEIGDLVGSTMPLIVLGHAALVREDFEEAKEHYLHCWKRSQKVGFPYSMQMSSKYLGKVFLSLGDIPKAEIFLLESLRITNDIGFVRDLVNLLYEFARLHVAQNNLDGALELLGLVIQHPASQETRWLEGRIRDSANDLLAEIEGRVPPDNLSDALERGRSLDLDTCIADILGVNP